MWQLSVLSALIVMRFCPAESEDTRVQDCGRYGPHTVGIDGEIDLKSRVAKPNESPWMVTILEMRRVRLEYDHRVLEHYLADGVLIHPSAVLASFHSLQGTKQKRLVVRAGDWDTASNGELDTQYQSVQEVMLGEPKNLDDFQPLIVILILQNPFEFAENVGAVCVPRTNDAYDRSRCIVSGWTGGFGDSNKNYLRRVCVPIISRDECWDAYDKYNDSHKDKIPLLRDSICAGSKEHPSWYESNRGSPLICPLVNDSSRYVLVGLDISRFPFKPARPQRGVKEFYLPSQFVDVAAHADWIDRKIWKRGMDSSSYTIVSKKN